MATEWDEVKRLAADFQRAQLGSTVQRLSERNCIEIVSKLLESGLLQVFFTTDGKEYVTPQHLTQEIKDELFVRGGRIHLAELAHILCLDYNHVEAKASELARADKAVHLILGQLIERDYINRLFEEINEKLQQSGQMSVGEIAKQYDLPPDFLSQMLRERLGGIVQGQSDPSDPHVVFTRAFIARHEARIRGALRAATRPTPLGHISHRYQLQERLLFNILDELLSSGQLDGSVSGGRSEKTASYVPAVYAKAQNEWVDAFFRQNQYLEYDALTRLGIGDPRGFIRKRLKASAASLTFLETCAIHDILFDRFEAALEEAVSSGSWVDAATLCPSFFSDNDVQQVLQKALQNSKEYAKNTRLFCDTILASGQFVQDLALPFEDLMIAKAEQAGQKGIVASRSLDVASATKGSDAKKEKKDDRRKKAAGGKTGGGTQGRETKTKSVKKKHGGGGKGGKSRSDDEEDEEEERTGGGSGGGAAGQIAFLRAAEIEAVLRKQPELLECPDGMIAALADYLEGPLRTKFQEVARSVFLRKSSASGSPQLSHAETQDKINGLITNVHLFVKGTEQFAAEDFTTQLQKYLLKTVCSDIANLVFAYVAHDNMLTTDQEANWTPEMRTKLLPKFPRVSQEALTKLNASLNGKSVEEFLESLELSLGPGICDMTIKKADKKKERQLVFAHRHALQQQLSEVREPSLVLHLAALVLFQTQTNCAVQASGKFVPHILAFLEPHLTPDTQQLLHSYQGLVIKRLTATGNEERAAIEAQLEEMTPAVKQATAAAAATKKGASSAP